MNMDRLAALIVRLFGFLFLTDAIVSLTYIPYHLANIAVANSRGLASTSAVMLQGQYTRTLIYLALSAVCLIGWRQVVRALTAGLTLTKKEDRPQP